MKRRFINILLYTFFLIQGDYIYSQNFYPSFDLPDHKSFIDINAHYEISSNSISNHFVQQYLSGKYIDSLHKQWMFAGLKKKNYLGADYGGSISYSFSLDSLTKKSNLKFFIKYNTYNHIDIVFTNDLCKLFFNGNKQFAGQSAIFDQSSLQILNYDQYQFGFTKKIVNKNKSHTLGIGLGLNNGYKNNIINFTEASLFTDANAEYIDLYANYEVYRSNAVSQNSNFFNGTGASINLYYSYKSAHKNIFNFSITELGFIRWNNRSQHFAKDTLIHFEGVPIHDILNIENPIFENANTDSIIQEYTYADTTTSYITPTPTSIHFSYLYNFSERARAEISILKKLYIHYSPFIKLKIQYLPTSKHLISLNLSYGGYSSFDNMRRYQIKTGLEYAHYFKNGIILAMGSDFLNGFLWRYSSTSQGAYISLKKYIF